MSVRRRRRSSSPDQNEEMSRISANIYLRSPCSKSSSFRFFNCRRCVTTPAGFLLLLASLVLFYNEFFVYEWSRLYWPEIESIAKK